MRSLDIWLTKIFGMRHGEQQLQISAEAEDPAAAGQAVQWQCFASAAAISLAAVEVA
jgi:hypothetical protein